jgi:hypothetical protein
VTNVSRQCDDGCGNSKLEAMIYASLMMANQNARHVALVQAFGGCERKPLRNSNPTGHFCIGRIG